jgi:hypothetical protein
VRGNDIVVPAREDDMKRMAPRGLAIVGPVRLTIGGLIDACRRRCGGRHGARR